MLPFELRFLAGKRAPDRLVIDLSSDSGVRLEPTDYPTIEYLENLLYVPAEYVPSKTTAGNGACLETRADAAPKESGFT